VTALDERSAGPAAAPATRAPTRGQLPQIDVVRVLTFAAVVAVHASSFAFFPTSKANGASLMTLHFTREVFFVITGFVLMHSYGRRQFSVRHFYTRRMSLVGLPYLAWSLIYFLVNAPIEPQRGLWWRTFGYDLLTGRASYQLYFLLVSLQAYLLLPLLIRLVKRTRGHHVRLFAASAVLQLVLTELIQATILHVQGAARVAEAHADVYLPTYQLYFLTGALAAWHLPRLQAWVESHGRVVAAALVGGAAVMMTAYWLQVPSYGAQEAQNVLQPAEVVWSLAVALALYWLGSRYAARPQTGPLHTFFSVGSRLSFGVYLIHPLVLDLLLRHGFAAGRKQVLPAAAATVVLVVVGVVVATVATALLQRTPLAALLTGREPKEQVSWVPALAGLMLVGALVFAAYSTVHATIPSLARVAVTSNN
jgi:surface polysaccharide O-acyltransferase-like enzyme